MTNDLGMLHLSFLMVHQYLNNVDRIELSTGLALVTQFGKFTKKRVNFGFNVVNVVAWVV